MNRLYKIWQGNTRFYKRSCTEFNKVIQRYTKFYKRGWIRFDKVIQGSTKHREVVQDYTRYRKVIQELYKLYTEFYIAYIGGKVLQQGPVTFTNSCYFTGLCNYKTWLQAWPSNDVVGVESIFKEPVLLQRPDFSISMSLPASESVRCGPRAMWGAYLHSRPIWRLKNTYGYKNEWVPSL